MLVRQRQKVDSPARARTAHNCPPHTSSPQGLIGPMTILVSTVSSLGEVGKRAESVVPLQRRSAHPYHVGKDDLGPTSDRLPVKFTCRVTALCKVLSTFLNSAVSTRINFLTFKTYCLYLSFSFQFFSLNCSLIWSRFEVSTTDILPCWQNPTTYSVVFLVSMWWNP